MITEGMLNSEVMQQILTLIRQYIIEAHPEPFHVVKEDDFENLYEELKAECNKPMLPTEFYFIANRLVCKMRDAHTRLNYERYDLYLPIITIWASDGFGILDTSNDFIEAKHSKILSMEGIPVEELLKNLENIVSSENIEWVKVKASDKLRRQSFLRHLLGKPEMKAVRLRIEKNGMNKEISMPFQSEEINQPEKSLFSWDIRPEIRAGYFALRECRYTEEYQQNVQSFFLEIEEKACRNLIIDLRGNSGGNSQVIDEFRRRMPGTDFLSFRTRIRMSKYAIEIHKYDKSSFEFEGENDLSLECGDGKWYKTSEDQKVTPFNGKVFILVDNRTFSAAVDFAMFFSDNHLAQIVGERTGGVPTSYGDLLWPFKLPESFSLSMSHKLFTRPDPSRDPAESLEPDIEIPTTLKDYFTGRDPQMEWLIKELKL